MSIKAVKWALSTKTTPIQKLVLVTIAEAHNGKTGACFPSQLYVAGKVGQTDRAIRNHLHDLELDGYLERRRHYDDRGHRDNDRFILNFDLTSPTGKDVPVDYRKGASCSDESLPEKNEVLPENSESPTGNVASATDEPESYNRNVKPEEYSAPSAPRSQVVDLVDIEFDKRFWPAYPHKVGKPSALKAWRKARKRKKASADEILKGLEAYKQNIANGSWRPQWKQPAAWLNDERWKDQPAAPSPQRTADQNIENVYGKAIAEERYRASTGDVR